MRTLLLALALLGLSATVDAQTVGVILNLSQTAVQSVAPNCGAVTYSPPCTTINTSDSRWTTFQAASASAAALALYQSAAQTQLSLGIVLTSTGTPALNDTYPIDPDQQRYLLGIYSGIAGATFLTGSISGTTLTVASTDSGAVAANQFLTGTGVTPGTQILSGSGSTWTVNNSQAVSTEAMVAGGLGTELPGGQSTVPLTNLSQSVSHNFDPVHFMYYRNAVVGYLVQVVSPQLYAAHGNTFPSNAITIP